MLLDPLVGCLVEDFLGEEENVDGEGYKDDNIHHQYYTGIHNWLMILFSRIYTLRSWYNKQQGIV